jgi:hypothetical protein
MGNEIGWLIERNGMGPLRVINYWDGVGFTMDSTAALRFARKEDAERAMEANVPFTERRGCRPTEHMWVTGADHAE